MDEKRFRKKIDVPVISDRLLILNVEDLIHTAFGSNQRHRVNFKLLQTTLHILAYQLRILEQEVEIKDDEITERAREEASYDDGYDDESGTYSSSSAEGEDDERRVERARRRAERRQKKDRAWQEERGYKKKRDKKGEQEEREGTRGKDEKEDGETSSKDRKGKGRSNYRDDKDKRSRDRDDKDDRSRDRDDKDDRSRDRNEKDVGSRDRDDKNKRSRDRDDKDKRSRDRDDKDERSRDRDDKDERSRDRDGSSRGRRGEDYGDEGGRERGRGKERRGERGADGRGGIGGGREDRNAQGQDLRGRDFGRQTSGTSISVSGGRPARVGSIEVVTASQFSLLEKTVKQLEQITGPLPEPVLPDNKTLRQDLAKGRTSLSDTMQAVQLNARVQVAEQGLYRMAELLTQLAQTGTLPPEFTGHVGAMEEYLQAARAAGYAPAGPGGSGGPVSPPGDHGRHGGGKHGARFEKVPTKSPMDEKKFTAPVAAVPAAQVMTWVTHKDMHAMLQQMKNAFHKNMNLLTSHARRMADTASNKSSSIAAKLEIAMQMNKHVSTLCQEAEDYAEQFSGIDSGITIQINSFRDQLVVMKNDLSGSLALVEASNNNAETTAVLELTELHQHLVDMMDNTAQLHQNLHITQQQISDEIRSFMKCVEALREQKADRDEVFDCLKDKANLLRLTGFQHEKNFANSRFEIEERILKFNEMFSRQGVKWKDALLELKAILDNKAEKFTLMELEDTTYAELNAIQQLLLKLKIRLGEPKVAILMRKLAKDASCDDSLTRAVMEPKDPTYSKPLPLPALRPSLLGAEQEPCMTGAVKLAPPDIRDHTCHRWAGGSHTLMGNIVKEQAESMPLQIKPTKKFEAYGSDGRLYMMEESMQPCAECNKLSTPGRVSPHPPTPTGAGARDEASAPPA